MVENGFKPNTNNNTNTNILLVSCPGSATIGDDFDLILLSFWTATNTTNLDQYNCNDNGLLVPQEHRQRTFRGEHEASFGLILGFDASFGLSLIWTGKFKTINLGNDSSH